MYRRVEQCRRGKEEYVLNTSRMKDTALMNFSK